MTATGFINEPVRELRLTGVRNNLIEALARLDGALPLRVPVTCGEKRRFGDELVSTDPCEPSRAVALAAVATPEEVDAAVRHARTEGGEWGRRSAAERAAILRRAAGILRGDRDRVCALAVREAGKPWAEADADICEAIDFIEYYTAEAVALEAGDGVISMPGERNVLRWAPRGVVAVVSPWNFPLAIVCGMVSAGLATGNAVVLKPAEQTPGCAHVVVDALLAAGVPTGVLSMLPGAGEVGAQLVSHPEVHTIAFTGSGAVGLEIVRTAAEVVDGQQHLKGVVAEMGGKNCVIVDADADLDEAVLAIVPSAFGFAGQKCSAASRVLAHEAVVAELTDRLAGAVSTLELGPAERFSTDVPALIDDPARHRVKGYIERGGTQGRVVARAPEGPPRGWYVAPALIDRLPSDSSLLHEEIFGPVLTIESVASVAEACARVDSLPFALTGALFSRNPTTVDRVAAASPVGNLYINRGTTGAMVGRQPFGGNRLSGTSTKAGGPGYLLRFVEPRVITENTMRHGLVVHT